MSKNTIKTKNDQSFKIIDDQDSKNLFISLLKIINTDDLSYLIEFTKVINTIKSNDTKDKILNLIKTLNS